MSLLVGEARQHKPAGLLELAARIARGLPAGRSLPDEVWTRRHRGIVVLVAGHAVGLVAFALVRGYTPLHSLFEGGVVALAIPFAVSGRLNRQMRSAAATLGLLTSSALLVHFSGGLIEMHFHFFVMLGVISLYQDWTPFLVALGYVVLHHGVVGVLDPDAVYNHPSAIANPWLWAFIHGAFVLGASAASLVSWRLNEESHAYAESILHSTGDGIVGMSRDGLVTFVNEAACKMLDRSAGDIVGKPAHDVVHGSWIPTHGPGDCPVEDHVHQRDGSALDAFVRSAGQAFPVELQSRPMRDRRHPGERVVTFRDITERQRAETELRNTLSLLSATLESTADGILVVDNAGKITSLNKKFVEMWSIPDEVVASRDDDRALASVLEQLKDPDKFVAKVRELYSSPDAESHDILEFKDGRLFERYSKPQQVSGISVGRVWSFRDVTEQRRLDRLKDEFLSAVSHELRTPLSAVLGYAVTLSEREGLTEPNQRELLSRLSANARKLQRLITDTLDLDRLARGILEPHRIRTDVSGLVERIAKDWNEGAQRPLELGLEQVTAHVDPAKLERIIENLLINAARHTPAGTPVFVRLWSRPDGTMLAVEDAGPGVPPELRESVFDSFRQGPSIASHSPGFGIGLSLVARFAELHGGRAWVEDRVSGGASFRVFLPLAAA